MVDQPDPVVGINHHNAFAQVLDHIVIELGEVGEIYPALTCQGFAFLQTPGQRAGRSGNHKDNRAEHAGGNKCAGAGQAQGSRQGLLAEYRQCAHSCCQQRLFALEAKTGSADQHYQQAADTAGYAAAGMH